MKRLYKLIKDCPHKSSENFIYIINSILRDKNYCFKFEKGRLQQILGGNSIKIQ